MTNGFEYDADDWDMRVRLSRLKNLTPMQRKRSILLYPKLDTPNLAFRNQAGMSFVRMSAEWGFDSGADGHGMACGDLDNDGDLDVVVNNLNSLVSIYRNDCSSPRLAIQLKGQGGNTAGTGAKLIVEGHEVTQSQEMISGGRYMSCDQSLRVFAAKRDSTHRGDRPLAKRSGQRSGGVGARVQISDFSPAWAAPGCSGGQAGSENCNLSSDQSSTRRKTVQSSRPATSTRGAF